MASTSARTIEREKSSPCYHDGPQYVLDSDDEEDDGENDDEKRDDAVNNFAKKNDAEKKFDTKKTASMTFFE